jgi:hypothetical protein
MREVVIPTVRHLIAAKDYEAAAYAEFAGKSLPTVAHWLRASGQQHAGEIIPPSNFTSSGHRLDIHIGAGRIGGHRPGACELGSQTSH